MGRTKSYEPFTKITVNIFESDLDRLKALYPDNYSYMVRNILRAFLLKQARQSYQTTDSNIALSLDDEAVAKAEKFRRPR